MNTARSDHAVLSEDDYVIAVGGEDDETSVELFTVSTNTWSTVTSLPQPLTITATLSCNILYAMDWDGRTFSISMSHWTKNTSREPPRPHPTWQPLPHDAPVESSTLTTVCGEVMAVGGVRGGTGDVYQLHQREWVRIGCMDTARRYPIVAVLRVPGHSMLVVGGWSSPSSLYSSLTAVELAVLC